jgi:hypothetical protein
LPSATIGKQGSARAGNHSKIDQRGNFFQVSLIGIIEKIMRLAINI